MKVKLSKKKKETTTGNIHQFIENLEEFLEKNLKKNWFFDFHKKVIYIFSTHTHTQIYMYLNLLKYFLEEIFLIKTPFFLLILDRISLRYLYTFPLELRGHLNTHTKSTTTKRKIERFVDKV